MDLDKSTAKTLAKMTPLTSVSNSTGSGLEQVKQNSSEVASAVTTTSAHVTTGPRLEAAPSARAQTVNTMAPTTGASVPAQSVVQADPPPAPLAPAPASSQPTKEGATPSYGGEGVHAKTGDGETKAAAKAAFRMAVKELHSRWGGKGEGRSGKSAAAIAQMLHMEAQVSNVRQAISNTADELRSLAAKQARYSTTHASCVTNTNQKAHGTSRSSTAAMSSTATAGAAPGITGGQQSIITKPQTSAPMQQQRRQLQLQQKALERARRKGKQQRKGGQKMFGLTTRNQRALLVGLIIMFVLEQFSRHNIHHSKVVHKSLRSQSHMTQQSNSAPSAAAYAAEQAAVAAQATIAARAIVMAQTTVAAHADVAIISPKSNPVQVSTKMPTEAKKASEIQTTAETALAPMVVSGGSTKISKCFASCDLVPCGKCATGCTYAPCSTGSRNDCVCNQRGSTCVGERAHAYLCTSPEFSKMSVTHGAITATAAIPRNSVATSKKRQAKSAASSSNAPEVAKARFVIQIAKMKAKGWACARNAACKDKEQHVLQFLDYCCDKKY